MKEGGLIMKKTSFQFLFCIIIIALITFQVHTDTPCKWGFIDKTGKIVIEPQFEIAWAFGEGLAPVKKDGKWGYMDNTGKIIIETKYDQVGEFSDGLAWVCTGDCTGKGIKAE